MELAKRFDLRFVIMADRWNREIYTNRSVEDIKERYYKVCGILAKLRGEKKVYTYDADHERRRKEQLKRLYDRTPEQVGNKSGGGFHNTTQMYYFLFLRLKKNNFY